MKNESTKLIGRVTVQLEDKATGKILQSETHENAVTDPFLYRLLAYTASNGGTAGMISNVLRGHTKVSSTPAGQYMANVSTGIWGIYAMKTQVPVTKGTRIAPYVNGTTALHPDVQYFNKAGTTVESANELVAVDARSGFDFAEGSNNTMTVEYVKNTGVGRVRSVIIGRAHDDMTSSVGLVMGEIPHQADWISGQRMSLN